MADPEDLDEDLFADLYEGDDNVTQPTIASPKTAPPVIDAPVVANGTTLTAPVQPTAQFGGDPRLMNMSNVNLEAEPETRNYGENIYGDNDGNASMNSNNQSYSNNNNNNWSSSHVTTEQGFTGTVGIKEDGKMFIGGLNWETTDQSLRDYFSSFGEVLECTVMRDGASGRSRGFGFLTFRDPKTVNTVMVKEHFLDGKIIDPKRAIPRDEQEKTSKIFVGGVSQEATERDFENYFAQFGRVIDATLMMDKDTGRPRGFGFVTFEGEAAVEATLAQPLEILGKPIEVKKAQPRGNMRDEDEGGRGKFNRRGQNGQNERFGRNQDNQGGNSNSQQNQEQQNGGQGMNGMSPQMMAQYWQRMQQYFAMMQQQMASGVPQGQGMGSMNMGGMNPAMMQQMMAMQGMGRGQNGSPNPQNPGQGMGSMNPAMMQQMAQMQQMQMAQQQQQQGGAGQGHQMAQQQNPQYQMQQQQQQQQQQEHQQAATQAAQVNGGNFDGMMSPMNGSAVAANRPGFNAQEQMAFEQRKYEQQQARRGGSQQFSANGGFPQGSASPTSWEGMYDDVPQPGGQVGGGRGGRGGQQNRGQVTPQAQAPLNAPTGPKNAGRPGANYRGGGRGGHRGFHPYAR